MRYALLILGMITVSGCNKDDDGGADSDTDTDTDTDPDYHPLVPEEYRYLWNTEGCDTSDGSQGASVYRNATEATSDGNNFSTTENWYWFFR